MSGTSIRARWRDVVLVLETILFSILVPGAVTYWLPRYVFGLWPGVLPSLSVWQVAAVALLTLGLSIYLRCLWEFAARGRGIPAPVDHPKQLVVTGLYQFVRNPMYFGVLLVLLGETLFFRSYDWLIYTMAWLLFVHLNVIFYEEPYLARKFGGSYLRYTSSVRRWVPGRRYRGD
jgi:protein-S-isoprenylcysteine O-methyltransferase Ste14